MRFHLDEHINPAVAEGLRRRGIDVTTAADAGLLGKSDSEHMEFARRSVRVMVSGDADFLALSNAGVEHSGLGCV
jgi:predicted nuclease of predicted toxin-antitoxin system